MATVTDRPAFSLAALPGFAPARIVPDYPRFVRAADWHDYGVSCGLEGDPLNLPPGLAHTFWAAATNGYRAGRAEAKQAAKEMAAWLVGQSFGLAGASPRLPYTYNEAERVAFREGWQAGDADRREAAEDCRALHGDNHDQQPDPNCLEAWTVSENEYQEISQGFVRYADEEIDRAYGIRASHVEF